MTDEQIKSVLMEVQSYALSQFPQSENKHEFSHRYCRRRKRIIERDKHPFGFYAVRIAAIILVLLFALLGTNEKVRAQIIWWTMERFNEAGFRYQSNAGKEIDVHQYTMDGYVPEHYQRIDRLEEENWISEIYASEKGELLIFSVASPEFEGEFYVLSDEEKLSDPINMDGLDAEVYLSSDGGSNMIVWRSKDGIMFSIKGLFDREQLTEMAESLMER